MDFTTPFRASPDADRIADYGHFLVGQITEA
jgi:hypothetical protein